MGAAEGVDFKQVDKFHYTIAFKGKTVQFELPDLSNVKPAPGMLRDDETYLGPIWDESGVQFFLVYNKPAKAFLYLLNETPKVDLYESSKLSPALTVGNRTSFAFYKDKLLNRQILIGDFVGHTMLNDYFDGPFDQLPDNFVKGTDLRDSILEVEPRLKSQNPDRYGADASGEFRYGITSYKYYGYINELKPIIECAEKNADPAAYYKCFDSTKANSEAEEAGGPDFLGAPPEGAQGGPAPGQGGNAKPEPNPAAPAPSPAPAPAAAPAEGAPK
jgi:hypothetical protein